VFYLQKYLSNKVIFFLFSSLLFSDVLGLWTERRQNLFFESSVFSGSIFHCDGLVNLQIEPSNSLRAGTWFKLICGASNQDLPAIRDLTFVYTLAGADCVDVAADPGVIHAARGAIDDAVGFAKEKYGITIRPPWLMMSINDDEDPHFRKAVFDPRKCPPDCPRPCERICPANAINARVIEEKCYGCGRCIPICPLGLIDAASYVLKPSQVRPLLEQVDCIEIHTQKGHLEYFENLWAEIGDQASRLLKVVAVSFPDMGEATPDILRKMNDIMTDGGKSPLKGLNIWQTDGRPMSGDIGKGTALASVGFAKNILKSNAFPFNQGQHYVQLAGGTNAYTVHKVQEEQLAIGGAAYGGYARTLVMEALDALGDSNRRVEEQPEVLEKTLELAISLVESFKKRKAPIHSNDDVI